MKPESIFNDRIFIPDYIVFVYKVQFMDGHYINKLRFDASASSR